MLDEGKIVRLSRLGMTREHLEVFARTLTHHDYAVVEATCNAAAVVKVVSPHVGHVVIANSRQVRLIAEARIKMDVIDATVLARLYASGFLPEGRPQHGRITKQGRTHTRTMPVEAAWQAVRGPGPLRTFYQQVSARRGNHVAAVVVTRKLAETF